MTDDNGTWRQWPALHGIGSTQRWRVNTRANGTPAARAPGVESGAADPPALCWLTSDGDHLALAEAPDSPRSQVWQNLRRLPSALGALAILPWIAERDPSADVEQTLHLEASGLPTTIAAGCAALAQRLHVDDLATLYAAILSGRRAVVLPESGAPWPAAALAALLLPLEPPLADRLSVCSGADPTASASEDDPSWWRVGDADPPLGETELAQGRHLARAVIENRPDALSTADAIAEAGETGQPALQFRVWGAASSGKTAYLAQLFASLDHGGDRRWQVIPPPGANRAWLEDQLSAIRRDNRFPPPTAAGRRDQLVYVLKDTESERRFSLAFEDRPGAELQALGADTVRRLASADALILLLDPERRRAEQEDEVHRAFLAIQQARGGEDGDPRPLAVCVSKCDQDVDDLDSLEHMLADPEAMLRDRIGDYVADALRQYWKRYRVFALSAAGLRISHGAVAPGAFYDESLGLRINPRATPIQLLDPLLWALDAAEQ